MSPILLVLHYWASYQPLLFWMTLHPILFLRPAFMFLHPKPLTYGTVEFIQYNRTVILKIKSYIYFLPPFPWTQPKDVLSISVLNSKFNPELFYWIKSAVMRQCDEYLKSEAELPPNHIHEILHICPIKP